MTDLALTRIVFVSVVARLGRLRIRWPDRIHKMIKDTWTRRPDVSRIDEHNDKEEEKDERLPLQSRR